MNPEQLSLDTEQEHPLDRWLPALTGKNNGREQRRLRPRHRRILQAYCAQIAIPELRTEQDAMQAVVDATAGWVDFAEVRRVTNAYRQAHKDDWLNRQPPPAYVADEELRKAFVVLVGVLSSTVMGAGDFPRTDEGFATFEEARDYLLMAQALTHRYGGEA